MPLRLLTSDTALWSKCLQSQILPRCSRAYRERIKKYSFREHDLFFSLYERLLGEDPMSPILPSPRHVHGEALTMLNRMRLSVLRNFPRDGHYKYHCYYGSDIIVSQLPAEVVYLKTFLATDSSPEYRSGEKSAPIWVVHFDFSKDPCLKSNKNKLYLQILSVYLHRYRKNQTFLFGHVRGAIISSDGGIFKLSKKSSSEEKINQKATKLLSLAINRDFQFHRGKHCSHCVTSDICPVFKGNS